MLVFTIFLIPDSPLRAILGFPFLLFFPGYVLISVLFPAKKDLGALERFTLSLCLSLAVVPLIGLILNYTPWGIRLYPIIASLFLLTSALSVASFYRRSKLPTDQQISKINLNFPRWSQIPKSDKLFLVGFLTAILAVSGLTVYFVSAPKIGEKFTEFYVLGSNGTLADYPLNLTIGENATVMLGITNNEYQNVTYKIVVLFNNKTLQTIENILTNQGMTWTKNFTFTASEVGEKVKLEFQLYKEDNTDPYRSLQLLVNVQTPQ